MIDISFDDGNLLDIHTAALLEKYNLRGTFYIPSTGELLPEQIKWLDSKGHTIGGHTVTHPECIRDLGKDLQYWEIQKNKDTLEKIIGKPLTKFCYPKGRYSETTKELVKKCGYKEARTTKVFFLGHSEDSYEQNTTIHIHPKRDEYSGKNWLKLAKEWWRQAKKEQKKYYVWGHSHEIEKYKLWEEFEELLKYLH
jgi:peptidoglycan/xylan/chitin deacetylase (PgdA/CDA1 family)